MNFSEAVRELLGDEGVRILNEPGMKRPDGRSIDLKKFKNSELINGIRGAMLGAKFAMEDYRLMLDRVSAIADELSTRQDFQKKTWGDEHAN